MLFAQSGEFVTVGDGVIGLGQLITLLVILWKGGRWTGCIEAKIGELSRRFDEHLAEEFEDLRGRVRTLEKQAASATDLQHVSERLLQMERRVVNNKPPAGKAVG